MLWLFFVMLAAASAQNIFQREGFYLVNLGNTDPYNVSEPGLYDKPPEQVRPDTTPDVDIRLPTTCTLSQTTNCRPDLDQCLLQKPTAADMNAICECYLEHARCFISAGCREALADSVVNFCFDTMRCRRTLCDGTSAFSAALSALTGVAAAGAALLLLAAARQPA